MHFSDVALMSTFRAEDGRGIVAKIATGNKEGITDIVQNNTTICTYVDMLTKCVGKYFSN